MVSVWTVAFGVLGVLGTIITIVVSILLQRKYHKKSLDRSLTPYVVGLNHLFSGLEGNLKDKLSIHYGDSEVERLTRLRVMIGNDGERAISEFKDPLTVQFPSDVELLEAEILHQQPAERGVQMDVRDGEESPEATFEIPLLNSWEYFIVEFLLKDSVDPRELTFAVTSEGLPPRLEVESPPPRKKIKTWGDRISGAWKSLAGTLFSGLLAASLAYILIFFAEARPDLFPFLGSQFTVSPLIIAGSIVIILLFIFLAIVTTVLFIATFSELTQTGQEGFDLPEEIMIQVFPMLGGEDSGRFYPGITHQNPT